MPRFKLAAKLAASGLTWGRIRLYVPQIDKPLEVLQNLDFPHVDVRRAVPGRGAQRRVVARESEPGQDARAFGQNPHPVVLGALDKAGDLDDEDPGAYKRQMVRTKTDWTGGRTEVGGFNC